MESINNNLKEFSDFQPLYCNKCGSFKITKGGKGYTKHRVIQKYLCRDCGNKSFDIPFKGIRSSTKLVQYVLSLQEKMSIKKIKEHLKIDLKIEIPAERICYWRRKFNPNYKKLVKKFSKYQIKDYNLLLPILQKYKGKLIKSHKIRDIFGYSKYTAISETLIFRKGLINYSGDGFYFVNGIK